MRGLLAGASLFAAALVLRFAAAPWLEGLPYLTFFPAVILSALVGGWRAGAAVAAASILAAWYFFVPPMWSWALHWPEGPVGLVLFALICALQVALIEALSVALRRQAAAEARNAHLLRDQAALLLELQHRVANNMQFIGSLLSLQARRIDDAADARAALADATQRLSLMAALHRRLHDPAALAQGVGQLLRGVLADLLRAAGREDVRVAVEVDAAEIGLSRATTLAMIVTEIATNALKHAFSGGGGAIDVSLRRHGALWRLEMRDDGPGRPAGYDADASASLGLRIVRALAQRLGGTVAFEDGPGAGVRVEFPA